MTTKLNLSVSSFSEGDPENAHSSNTNISTSDPQELIDVLRQLSGMKSPEAKSCGCGGNCQCNAGMVDEEADKQEPANAPKPRTLADLRDVIDAAGGTAHTAQEPVRQVPARSGDNPLIKEGDVEEAKWRYGCDAPVDVHVARGYGYKTVSRPCGSTGPNGDVVQCEKCEKDPSKNPPATPEYGDVGHDGYEELQESLAREWQRDKLSHIAESFNPRIAEKAIGKGKTEYRHKLHEFAIREEGNKIKVFPILEGRVMTQVPLYVTEGKLGQAIGAAALALGLGGVAHMVDAPSYEHNPNIIRLEKQLSQTRDPALRKEILDAIEREKAFQDAKGLLLLARIVLQWAEKNFLLKKP